MDAIKTLLYKLLRGALVALLSALISKGWLTEGNVADVALVLSIGLVTLISYVVSAIMHKLKIETAAVAPQGTPVGEIKAAAWEVFMSKLGFVRKQS
jgi:hypothetical protein